MAYPSEPMYTRREGDDLSRRVADIDREGTRGMQVLAAQTQQNTAAIGELRNQVRTDFAAHTRQHEQELAAIRGRRKTRATNALAVWAAAVATLSLLVYVAVSVTTIRR